MSKTTKITARKLTNSFNNRGLSFVFMTILGLAVLGLTACSSGGDSAPPSPPPVENQDASGLYMSGTGTLNGVAVSDLVGFVDNGRIMFFSVAKNILIDGTINDKITGNDYTATVRLYVDGVVKKKDISVTGTVTTESKISGTMGTDNFSLLFDPLYKRGATIARIETDTSRNPWGGLVLSKVSGHSVTNLDFTVGSSIEATFVSLAPFTTCFLRGTFLIPKESVNIYTTNNLIKDTTGGGDCDASLISDTYEGFAAVVDGSTSADNTLLYAVTDGNNSVFGIFTR